jgi:LPS export ABC transporter protein LptC
MIGGSGKKLMINSIAYRIAKISTRLGSAGAGILFVCLLFSACKNDINEVRALTSASDVQEDKATDIEYIYSDSGKVKSRLFAHEYTRNETAKPPYIDLKKGLKVEFYNDSGNIESVLTARSARYYEQQQNVHLQDSVQVITKKGERLNTDELIWNQSIQRFFTERHVTITTPQQVLEGDGMEANKDFTWYQITNLKGRVNVNKSEMPTE